MFQIKLKELRENMGISQYELAERLGVAQSTIGGWESGKREPNFKTIKIIADFFNVSVDYLLGRTDSKSSSEMDIEHYEVPSKFTDAAEARKYLSMHQIFGSDGFNISKLNDKEAVEFANELMKQMELVSHKFKK
jgi:transcriptional regulator with XRE-family HTH domain